MYSPLVASLLTFMASIFTSNAIKFVLITSTFHFLYVIYKYIHHRNRNVLLHSKFGWFLMNTNIHTHSQFPHLLFFVLSLDFVHRSILFCQSRETNGISFYRQFNMNRNVFSIYLRDVLLTMLFSFSLFLYIFFLDIVSVEIKTMELNLWNQIGEFAAETKAKCVRGNSTTMISNGRNILWLLILDCHINLSTT